MVLADDVTGVGVTNDWLVPLVYLGATLDFLYANQENIANGIAYMTEEMAAIKARVDAQIVNLAKKMRPRQGNVYELYAPHDGYYRNVRTGKEDFYMKAGDIWKYGESHDPENRYSPSSYEKTHLEMNIYYPKRSRTENLIQEKRLLLEYYIQHGHLPPGNRIFK